MKKKILFFKVIAAIILFTGIAGLLLTAYNIIIMIVSGTYGADAKMVIIVSCVTNILEAAIKIIAGIGIFSLSKELKNK